MEIPEKYVLLTPEGTYFVEYLLNQLILSDSITHAMVFNDRDTAVRFKHMLLINCNLDCSINTYID